VSLSQFGVVVLLAHLDVLNTETKLTVFVESWLIGDTHSNFKLLVVSSTDSLGAFVNVQVRSDSMASTMLVIQTNFPQVLSSQYIHISSSNRAINWPHDSFKTKDSKKNSGVSFFLESSWRLAPEMTTPSDVSSSIEVLTTTI
jgi:hypothetical protein